MTAKVAIINGTIAADTPSASFLPQLVRAAANCVSPAAHNGATIRSPKASKNGAKSTERTNSVPTKSQRYTGSRSEEHTSELQSRGHLVCRLLLEKKKI